MRKKYRIVESDAEIIREDNLDKIRGLLLIIHFDTKLVKQYRSENMVSEIKERISISVSSPDAVEPLDVLLGVLEIESSKGEEQALAKQSILENYGLVNQIIGACADTTGSNTGRFKGAIVNIIKYALDDAVLWLLCRHHIMERHIHHVMTELQGQTKSPVRSIYKHLQDIWPKIREIVDQENLRKFNWNRPEFAPGTVLNQLCNETAQFCKTALLQGTFQRGDYKYLTELTAIYLGVEVEKFKFLQPGANHEARFMADCLYLLVLQMNRAHVPGIDPSVWETITTATDYIVFFHTMFFLKSPMAAQAPRNDLQGLQVSLMLMTNELYSKYARIGKCLHDSLMRHLWYLTPQLVIFAPADDDLDNDTKTKILTKLLSFDQPSNNDFEREKPETVAQISPMSSLEDFVSEQSYLYFSKLKIEKKDIENWNFELTNCHSTYTKFKHAVNNTAVVNDRAERHIILVQDFIDRSHSEAVLQDSLQVVTDNRKKISKEATKKDFKKL